VRKWPPRVGDRVHTPFGGREGVDGTVTRVEGKGDHTYVSVEMYIDGGMEDEEPTLMTYPIRFITPVADEAA
jgi:hypothetical protein